MKTITNCAPGLDLRPRRRFGGLDEAAGRSAFLVVKPLLRRLRRGTLTLRLPNGEEYRFAGPQAGAQAEIRVRRLGLFRRLLTGGYLALAEGYLDGLWDTPDLLGVMTFGLENQEVLIEHFRGRPWTRLAHRLYHRLRDNNRRGSRRNIAAHYDLGNDFYAAWLDAGMTYSSACFEHRDQSLAAAQEAKYRRIAAIAGLKPGLRVLEVGCGWGGFMEYAAGRCGCRVEGITLSRGQLAFANARMADSGLAGRAAATLTDYRDTGGRYDALVSIEMLEAVGEAHWPRYFEILAERLRPGAAAVIQVITMADRFFEGYRRQTDFIQRYVFPGGMLPSPAVLQEQAARAGLVIDHAESFGLDYARTLAIWRERFLAAWPALAEMGFDERFRRLWTYYLCYCEAGFRAGTIDVGIYRLRAAGASAEW